MKALSTRELIRLVILAAFNLALFQGAWWLMIVPPIGLLVIVLDFVLFVACVRGRALSRRNYAATVSGVVSALAIRGYVDATGLSPRFSLRLLAMMPDALAARLIDSIRALMGLLYLDFIIFQGLGVLAMFLAAWMAERIWRPEDKTFPSTRVSSP